MTAKPVYRSGVGFGTDETRSPRSRIWWLAVPAGLALAGFVVWRAMHLNGSRVDLTVLSDPPGAEILINLSAGHGRTPATISWPAASSALVQVRLPGFESNPLGWRLAPTDFASGPRELSFSLRPSTILPSSADPLGAERTGLTPPTPSPPDAQTKPAPAVGSRMGTQAGESPIPTDVRSIPADPGETTHTIAWQNWDRAFRLKVDGRVLPVAAAQAFNPGTHRIQVDLLGRILLDTLLGVGGTHILSLPPRRHFIEVRVEPEGEIVSGDAVMGKGRCLLPRDRLPILLRFPALAGLLPPPPLNVDGNSPQVVEVSHQRPIHFSWTPASEGGLRLEAKGYVMPDGVFQADKTHGPDVDGNELVLGRAFHDRRPGGSQALRLRFDLPDEVNAAWPAMLDLEARDSGQRYPLTLTRGATLTVLLNGTPLARDVPVSSAIEGRSWPVSSLLKPGRNLVQIQSSEDSRSSTLVRRVGLRIEG